MGIGQDMFNEACRHYDQATDLVKTVAETFRDAERAAEGSSRFNPGITLAEFDQILQGSLLTQALADGNFDRIERQFIDKITDHGDLLKYIESQTRGDICLTWDKIAWMDGDTQGKLLAILPKIMKSRCEDFITPFVIIENLLEKNLMEMITEKIVRIGECLAKADGKVDKIEPEAMAVMLNALLLEPWQQARRELR